MQVSFCGDVQACVLLSKYSMQLNRPAEERRLAAPPAVPGISRFVHSISPSK